MAWIDLDIKTCRQESCCSRYKGVITALLDMEPHERAQSVDQMKPTVNHDVSKSKISVDMTKPIVAQVSSQLHVLITMLQLRT